MHSFPTSNGHFARQFKQQWVIPRRKGVGWSTVCTSCAFKIVILLSRIGDSRRMWMVSCATVTEFVTLMVPIFSLPYPKAILTKERHGTTGVTFVVVRLLQVNSLSNYSTCWKECLIMETAVCTCPNWSSQSLLTEPFRWGFSVEFKVLVPFILDFEELNLERRSPWFKFLISPTWKYQCKGLCWEKSPLCLFKD